MAVASTSIPMAGAPSVASALGLHHDSIHSLNHSNILFGANSIARGKILLTIKPITPYSHTFPLISSLRHYNFKCRVAMEGNEGEGRKQSYEEDEYEGEEEEEDIDEDESEGGVQEGEDRRRLYVGNLPYSLTESQLSDIFQEAGKVISVEVLYDRVTDRSRGFGFVTMGSVEEAKEAIHMFDGSQVGGRTVKVNFPEVPMGGEREIMEPRIRRSYRGFIDSPHKVYAGNLSWGVTSETLKEAFQEQPGFVSAKVIYERESGRSRGFGFVSFSSAEDADSALNAMNGVEVEGRPLRLSLAAQRERSTLIAIP